MLTQVTQQIFCNSQNLKHCHYQAKLPTIRPKEDNSNENSLVLQVYNTLFKNRDGDKRLHACLDW